MSYLDKQAAMVRAQVEYRRRDGLDVLGALAAVCAMYAEVVTRLIAADKTVPSDILGRMTIADDWQATLTPGNPYHLTRVG